MPSELGRGRLAHSLATSQGVARGALAATASLWSQDETEGCLETVIGKAREALLPFLRERMASRLAQASRSTHACWSSWYAHALRFDPHLARLRRYGARRWRRAEAGLPSATF